MQVIIFGNNDFASLANFYFKHDTSITPVAYCVDGDYLTESIVDDLPVIATEEIKKTFPPDEYCFFVPLADNKLREQKSNMVKKWGYQLTKYVSSKATVFGSIGDNCFIMENNVIQPFVTIGDNVILWSGNHIGHHSTIDNNVFFASHVVLSGRCIVRRYCWLGVNATIRNNIELAEGTFVAMGACVYKNTKPWSKHYGFRKKPKN